VKLSRRSLIVGAGAAATVAGSTYALAQRPQALTKATAIEVRATPLQHFSLSERDRRRFGGLTFRSGLVLQSPYDGFGGFSGLWRSPDGRELVALTDNAQWLSAKVEMAQGQLSGLTQVVMAPVLGASGQPLRRSRYYDTEGLTIVDGVAYVSIERRHAVVRFDWARNGMLSRAQPVSVPPAASDLPSNSGLEAIGVAPGRSPAAGALVAIAERAGASDEPTLGFILTGPRRGSFEVARSGDYDVTDLAFLPNGDLLLLERRFSLLRGPAARIRRIRSDSLRPGATLDGNVTFEADAMHEIDNMEGIALHRVGGETIVTLISDNNFNSFQRTLLLEFTLSDLD